jgi:hypothetical protein
MGNEKSAVTDSRLDYDPYSPVCAREMSFSSSLLVCSVWNSSGLSDILLIVWENGESFRTIQSDSLISAFWIFVDHSLLAHLLTRAAPFLVSLSSDFF